MSVFPLTESALTSNVLEIDKEKNERVELFVPPQEVAEICRNCRGYKERCKGKMNIDKCARYLPEDGDIDE